MNAGNIREAGRALLALINDVLNISKIESGKLEVNADQYEMKSLLYNVFTMISMKAEEKGLVFRMEIDETLPDCLYGDEMRLKQCLVNLLTNAVKYTQNGKIIFKVSWKPVSEEELILQQYPIQVSALSKAIWAGYLIPLNAWTIRRIRELRAPVWGLILRRNW